MEVREQFLPFSPPLLGNEEIEEVCDTLRTPWISRGPKTRQFEEEFQAKVCGKGALALNSCTSGLHLALVAAGVGPGDEVITTANTFAASVNVIEHTGATPVLVDVDSDTLNISPAEVEKKLTKRTRAIIPVHFAGHPAEMDALETIAADRKLVLVEDAAHALGAAYRGVPVGSRSNPAAFSFYATKNITTGDGGMLTGSGEWMDRARLLSLHGMSQDSWNRYGKGGKWFYEVVAPGYKYNLNDILSSLGLCQLRKLDAFQQRRREIVAFYNEAFGGDEALECPVARPEVDHAWHLYVLRLVPGALRIGRDVFLEKLGECNIGTSVHFIPVHMHPYYRDKYGFEPGSFPVAFRNFERYFSLPLHPGLTDDDLNYVVDSVKFVAGENRR